MDRRKIILYCDWAIIACLCLLIFCLPFAKAGVETFTWTALFLWMLKRIFGYRADSLWGFIPRTELNKALGIFIAINALSMIFSTNFGLSLRGFFGKELKFLAVYFMMVEVINSRNRLRNVLIMIIASALLITADAAVQYFRGVDFIRGYEWMLLRASFSTRNGFAAWLIVIIPLFLGLLMIGKSINKGLKVLLLVLVVALLLCLLVTFVRGAWFGFIVSILLMVGFVFNKFALKIKLFYLSIGVGLLIIFLILPQPIKSKIKTIGRFNFKTSDTINARIKSTTNITEPGVNIRIKLWKEALRMIKDYNFTGSGLNTYSIVARNYKSFYWGGVYPHNSYLQMAAETGLFGLVAFFWVLFIFFKIGLRYLSQNRDFLVLGLLSGILAFLVHAFFDNHLYALQFVVLFWYMLGLTTAVIRLRQKEMF